MLSKSPYYYATIPGLTIFPSARVFVYSSNMCEGEVRVGGEGIDIPALWINFLQCFCLGVKKCGLRLKNPLKLRKRNRDNMFLNMKIFDNLYLWKNEKRAQEKIKIYEIEKEKINVNKY